MCAGDDRVGEGTGDTSAVVVVLVLSCAQDRGLARSACKVSAARAYLTLLGLLNASPASPMSVRLPMRLLKAISRCRFMMT